MKCKQNFDFHHFATFSRQPTALKKSKENTAKQKESTKTKVFEENKKANRREKHIQKFEEMAVVEHDQSLIRPWRSDRTARRERPRAEEQ
jgi:hypothetical protein